MRFYVNAIADGTGGEGAEEAAIVYAVETTEQKALESQMAQSQKMQAVGQLAGGIAHDFNNVLTAIIMASDLLLTNHRPSDPSFPDIMNIKQNANRAASLVRQLLAFSRKQTLRPEVLSLTDVLADLRMLLSRLVGTEINLKIDHGRDVWPIKADIGQFEQVIVNLAVNARDAMPDGGDLTIRTRNVTAGECGRFPFRELSAGRLCAGRGRGHRHRHRARRDREDLRAVLHHQGGGQGHRPRAVDGLRHHQADRRLHLLQLRARQGHDLPYLPAAPFADASDAAERGRRSRPGRDGIRQARCRRRRPGPVGLGDDAAGRGRGRGAHGWHAGADCRAAIPCTRRRPAIEALEVFRELNGKVDMVVSDVVMPEMDGPTLLGELRKLAPQIKFVFVSGYAEDAFAKNLPQDAQFGFLPKPFSLKQLATVVKEVLEAPEG